MLHPRPGCVGQHEPAQVWKPGCPAAGVCASTPWPALLLTSGRGHCKPSRLRKMPVVTWAALRSRFSCSSQRRGVCLLRQRLCVCAVPWAACTAPSGLGSKAASTSQPPTISKELSSLLQSKSKQNTTTDAVCKTKPYLSWDLRTHTKFPASGRASGGTTTVNGYISGGAKELWGQPDFG